MNPEMTIVQTTFLKCEQNDRIQHVFLLQVLTPFENEIHAVKRELFEL